MDHDEDAQYMDSDTISHDGSHQTETEPERTKADMRNCAMLEPAVTIVRGEADGTTTYYKIISTSTPGASLIPVGEGMMGGADSIGKVQLINGSLHFPNGTVVAPSTMSEILNSSDAAIGPGNLPTMVSVSIPPAGASRAYRPINLPELSKKKTPTSGRDERRRQTHNEVERRRRDKINQWITKLQAIVPAASGDNSKHAQSKGSVLSKAVDYINQLNSELQQARLIRENSQRMHILAIENEVYRKQVDVMTKFIQEQGLELPPNMPIAALNALQELQQGTAILIAQQTRPPSK